MTDCQRLMDALGKGELPADLATHAASCPHCSAAVAAYRALEPKAGVTRRAPLALTSTLEHELARTAGTRARSALWEPLLLGVIQAAVAMGVVVFLGNNGRVLGNREPAVVLVVLGLALGACAVGGTLAAVAPGFPRLRWFLFGAAVSTAVLLGACGSGLPALKPFLVAGRTCASVELACAALPLGVTLWLQRRFAFDPLRAVLGSVAAAATGVFALHLHCPVGTADHLYAFHVAPWVLLGGLGLWIRSRLGSRSYAP
ncbi:MAG TPA: hypothetical protein VFA20_21185 [Myxococcaceae bacterium]|nr:hypothetical protein [Myxococcaceae bacterium]